MRDISREFQKIEAESLRKDFSAIVAESHEETHGIAAEEPGGAEDDASDGPGERLPTSISTPSISPKMPVRERSIRFWAAISKSARSWIS